MPRKAKEAMEKEESNKNRENKLIKKVASGTKKTANSSDIKSTKKSSTKKASVSSKKEVEKQSTKATVSAGKTTKTKTKNTSKSSSKSEKKTTRKSITTSTKNTTISKKKFSKAIVAPEYYDLPYHYNQTIVKVLAQTPKTLFVYWDVSEQDKIHYEEQFGPDFFNNTIPFLRVKNETYGYSFEVDVDDFANGWYLHVDDARSNYSIELLRKQRPYTARVVETPIYITSSNRMETPNDHILFDTNYNAVYFRDVKTNQVTAKNMSQISLLKKVGKIYNIYDFYKRIYKNEDISEIFDLNHPTSGNPTSTFR